MTTDPHVPIISGSAPVYPPPAAPPPSGGKRVLAFAAVATVALVIGGLGAALFFARTAQPNAGVTPPLSTPTRHEPPTPAYGELGPENITLTVLVTGQECFGSAGCLVHFEIDVEFAVAEPLEPGSRWSVTWQLTGAEDAYIDTFDVTISGDEARYPVPSGFVSTPPDPTLTAAVTSVRER